MVERSASFNASPRETIETMLNSGRDVGQFLRYARGVNPQIVRVAMLIP